ncbi:YkvA family protein [Marinospirillum minutulum]|uniref:YkvA family protein n=1 Tax=Marinospirillum minutulum TaxID=64974 RepID=UPI00040AB304|nr:hypothetical protein [Marinospirillum minutulum]
MKQLKIRQDTKRNNDLLPVVGYTDDVGVLVAALAVVSAYIKEEHQVKAQQMLQKWLG